MPRVAEELGAEGGDQRGVEAGEAAVLGKFGRGKPERGRDCQRRAGGDGGEAVARMPFDEGAEYGEDDQIPREVVGVPVCPVSGGGTPKLSGGEGGSIVLQCGGGSRDRPDRDGEGGERGGEDGEAAEPDSHGDGELEAEPFRRNVPASKRAAPALGPALADRGRCAARAGRGSAIGPGRGFATAARARAACVRQRARGQRR